MPLSTTESVAATVRAELARRRSTYADMARALNMSPVAVSRRMSGETPIDVNELAAIAAFLQVPIQDLLPAMAAS